LISLETTVDPGSNGQKKAKTEDTDASQVRNDLHKFVDVEYLTVKNSEDQKRVQGPHDSYDRYEVSEEAGHESGHLIWHSVSSQEDILKINDHFYLIFTLFAQ
jgi:hypothetical protein